MKTEYHTERRTVVTTLRPRAVLPLPLKAPIKPRFEIIGEGETVLVDALLPRKLALLILAMLEA